MIIPSIDIMDGKAVQLIQGRHHALDGGDPLEVMERFRVAGPVAVIDLDAALGKGDNTGVIRRLVRMGRCRVGGGIRSVERALEWLDAGADQVILGTAAVPEVLGELPRERTIAALDAWGNEVVVEGWTRNTGVPVESRIDELRDMVGGFLITFVKEEGGLGGLPVDRVGPLVERAGPVRLTVAGGVATAEEIGEIDRIGADAQVGMALYTGRFSLGAGIAACLRGPGPNGLWPTVVADDLGRCLGLVWSSTESLELAVEERRGIYQSRSRGLWRKGETSGSTQELLAVALDCDRDAIRVTVRQEGDGFCHTGSWSCFGGDQGWGALSRRLKDRISTGDPESYTRRLLARQDLLKGKLLEEAAELADATEPREVLHEAADLLYFASVALARGGVDTAAVLAELDRRGVTTRRRTASLPEGIEP
jgi:phosphoribosyl-ATP pyrophosphohydrolase